MFDSAEPGDGPLHTESKATVRDTAVTAQIEIPGIILRPQSLGGHASGNHVRILLTLAAADNLAVPLGSEQVKILDDAGIGRRHLHVERLRLTGIVGDKYRLLELARNEGFVASPPDPPPR